MATSTTPDDKTQEGDNPAQDEFNKIVEHSFSPEELEERKNSAYDGAIDDHLANNEAADENQKLNSHTVNLGGGNSDKDDKFKKISDAVLRKKKSLYGGGVVGTIIAMAIFFFSTGPLQLVHLSQMLQTPFQKQNNDSSQRVKGLFRAARNKDVGETRVGRLGSKIFGKTISQLNDIGVEIERNPISGAPTKTTIDTDKLQTKYPELEGMGSKEKISFLADKLGIPEGALAGSGSKFTINQQSYDLKTSRLLANNTVGLLDDGKILTGIKARTMTKFFNLPSLFHPMKRAVADKYNKLAGKALQDAEAKDEQARESSVTEPVEADGVGALEDYKGKSTGLKGLYGKAVVYVGGACLVYNTSSDIIKINRDLIVLPSALRATDLIAAGAQVQSGRDLSTAQAGEIVNSLKDKNGKTVWQGAAMYALAHKGQKVSNLQDISPDYRQAFSNKTTFASISGWAKSVIPGPPGTTCSPAVQFAFLAGQVFLSFSAEISSAGTLSPAVFGAWAAGELGNQAISAVALHFITKAFIDSNTTKLAADAFAGEVGGNLLPYGARAAADIAAIGSGAVSLGNNNSTILADAEQQQFQSSSIANRLFNPHDYRSALSNLIDNTSGSPSQTMSRIASLFTNFGSTFTHSFSLLQPHAHAANTQYDWSFPQYGIPTSVLNDPNLDDPYANADYVAKNLLDTQAKDTHGMLYTDKAKACFGVDISTDDNGVWDVVPGSGLSSAVDPNGEDYTSANCDDNNEDWHRVLMFVFDTTTMKAATCYAGDENDPDTQQSCTDLGEETNGQAATVAPSSDTTFNIATYNILGVGHPTSDKYGPGDERMDRAVKIMKDNNFDIVGLQELTPSQRNELLSTGGDKYSIYPATAKFSTCTSDNSILWDKSKFSLVGGGTTTIYGTSYCTSSTADIPWVKLKVNSTGQEFYVSNTHDPVGDNHKDDRLRDARIHLADIQAKMHENLPVFLTGDFNSGYTVNPDNDYTDRSKLTYCVITATGDVRDAYDVVHNRTGNCPTTDIKAIDHIYVSKDVKLTNWQHIKNDDTNFASDHDPVVATADFPGAGATSGDVKQLAQQILSNSNVSYPLDAVSSNGSTKAVLQALAAGQKAPVTCPSAGVSSTDVNPNILKFILDLAGSGKVGVNAITDKCHTAGSNHYKGKAVDFECHGVPFDVSKGDSIASKYGGKRNSETCSGDSHWHYDFL